MNKPTNSKKFHKAAWQGYTPSRREWIRHQVHPWWVEALAPWLIGGPLLLFVVLAYLFGWV